MNLITAGAELELTKRTELILIFDVKRFTLGDISRCLNFTPINRTLGRNYSRHLLFSYDHKQPTLSPRNPGDHNIMAAFCTRRGKTAASFNFELERISSKPQICEKWANISTCDFPLATTSSCGKFQFDIALVSWRG